MLALAGCSPRPEQLLLERFFELSRLRDRTGLQRVATVVFEPREDGIVTTFTITNAPKEEARQGGVARTVTLEAPVTLSSGEVVVKTLVVTMERSAGATAWMVTGVATVNR